MRLTGHAWRIFIRCKRLSMVYLAVLGWLIYHLCTAYAYVAGSASGGYTADAFIFNYKIMAVAVAGYALFLYLGYEMMEKVKGRKLEECLCVYPGGVAHAQSSMLCVLALLALPYAAIVFTFTLMGYAKLPDYTPLLVNTLLACTLYYLLLPIVAAMMGAALGALFPHNRFPAYFIVVILLIGTTTFSNRFVQLASIYSFSPSSVKLVDAIYHIKDYLELTPYGLPRSIGIDWLYGTWAEPSRFLLMFFWLFLSAFILYQDKNRRGYKRGMAVLLAALTGVCLVGGGILRGSLVRYDLRLAGFYSYDQRMYRALEQEYDGEIEPGFSIRSYSGDIHILNNLSARLDMQLSDLEPDRDAYVMTLYHKYKISSIQSGGRNIGYTREGDFLVIPRDQVGADGCIRIAYAGSSPRFYANFQAAMLPGYFPYYPVEGNKLIYSRPTYDGFNASLPDTPRHFDIAVHTTGSVRSNLPGENNHFTGDTRGMTLIKGMIEPIGTRYPVWGSMMEQLQLEGGIDGLMDQVYHDLKELENGPLKGLYHVRDYTACPVFMLPQTFSVGSGTERFADLGDHLLISNGMSPYILFPETFAADSGYTQVYRQTHHLPNILIDYLQTGDYKQPENLLNDFPEAAGSAGDMLELLSALDGEMGDYDILY
nr:hypothetical protein [bacterium]